MRVLAALSVLSLALAALSLGCGSAGSKAAETHASPLDGGDDASPVAPVGPAADAGSVAPPQGTDSPDASGDAAPPPAPTSCSGKVAQPLDATITIVSHGTSRTANVHVPASYDPTHPTPLVLNFHGYTSDATQQALLTQMNAKSDAEGFVVAYPQGLNASWNAGACCGTSASSGVDDVGFVSDLLDALENQLCIDTRRVFATGMSNGGFLSHRLGCELATRIAAIAPVAGVLGVTTCTPPRAVPVMHFHGTADPLVPYDGSPTMGFISVADSFAGWATRDGCSGKPVDSYDNGDTHCSTYAACAGGATVTLCTVDGGGHTWPGGTPVPSLGYTTPNISATDAMWTFFTQHPMP
jgi:polyhydroxybutyrate depolymerase